VQHVLDLLRDLGLDVGCFHRKVTSIGLQRKRSFIKLSVVSGSRFPEELLRSGSRGACLLPAGPCGGAIGCPVRGIGCAMDPSRVRSVRGVEFMRQVSRSGGASRGRVEFMRRVS